MPKEQYSNLPMGRPDTKIGKVLDVVVGVPTLGLGTLASRGIRSFLRQRGIIKPSVAERVLARDAKNMQDHYAYEVKQLKIRAEGGDMDAAMVLAAKRQVAEASPKGSFIRCLFDLD